MNQLKGIVIDKKNASTLEEAQAQAEKSMDSYLCSHSGETQGYFDWYANHSEGRWSNDKDLEPVMDLATDKGMKVYNRLKENNLYGLSSFDSLAIIYPKAYAFFISFLKGKSLLNI